LAIAGLEDTTQSTHNAKKLELDVSDEDYLTRWDLERKIVVGGYYLAKDIGLALARLIERKKVIGDCCLAKGIGFACLIEPR
jgi:hypothetical protein